MSFDFLFCEKDFLFFLLKNLNPYSSHQASTFIIASCIFINYEIMSGVMARVAAGVGLFKDAVLISRWEAGAPICSWEKAATPLHISRPAQRHV